MQTRQTNDPDSDDEIVGTGRLEAFSDGVFAIAITLLVLEIGVPSLEETEEGAHLLDALGDLWPSYFAYATSFLTILIMWVNHHTIFRMLRRADHTLLLFNGLLLMAVTFVPFPTALLAEYIEHDGEDVAAAVYAGTFTVIAVIFNLLWRYVTHKRRLLEPEVSAARVQAVTSQYRFGPFLYLVAFLLAFVSVVASVGVCLLLAVLFTLPPSILRSWTRSNSSG
jgi:uncharacterized membrane protein